MTEEEIRAHRPLPGRMDSFIVKEISAVDRPACEHCKVAIIKSAGAGQDDDVHLDENDRVDSADVDWPDMEKAHAEEFHERALKVAALDGTTYEHAYRRVAERHPLAARRVISAATLGASNIETADGFPFDRQKVTKMFEAIVAGIAETRGISYAKAYTAALEAAPQLYAQLR
jgi:hypothetical protein